VAVVSTEVSITLVNLDIMTNLAALYITTVSLAAEVSVHLDSAALSETGALAADAHSVKVLSADDLSAEAPLVESLSLKDGSKI